MSGGSALDGEANAFNSSFALDNGLSFRSLVDNAELLASWDAFVDASLRPILEHQIGSSNVYPSSAMDFGAYPLAQASICPSFLAMMYFDLC